MLIFLLLRQLGRLDTDNFRPVALNLEVGCVVRGRAHREEVRHGGEAVVVVEVQLVQQIVVFFLLSLKRDTVLLTQNHQMTSVTSKQA